MSKDTKKTDGELAFDNLDEAIENSRDALHGCSLIKYLTAHTIEIAFELDIPENVLHENLKQLYEEKVKDVTGDN